MPPVRSVLRLFHAVVAALWLGVCAAFGATERGFPLITVYPPEVHKAGPQTFEIAQDARGVLYFGNLAGVLTWDGAWWRLLALPDEQAALSVGSDANGRVVVGMVDDLGVLGSDASGAMRFESLVPLVPRQVREFGEVRGVCAIPGGFLFVTEKRLLLWDGAKSIRPAGEHAPNLAPRGCSASGDDVWLYGRAGLQRFDTRAVRVEPAAVAGTVQYALHAEGGRIIAAVKDVGLVSVANGVATPFALAASEYLRSDFVSAGARLGDGRLVFTTRQSGLVILDRNGDIEQIIDDTAGLPDAVLAAAFTDREGALWLGMEGPLVRIDVASPVSLYDGRRGLKGAIGDVARYEGRLYAGGSHGLYAFDPNGVAQRIEEIDHSVWRLLPLEDQMLIATSKGVYRIRGTKPPELVLTTEVEIYDVHRSTSDPSRIWLAIRSGIGSIRREGDTWRDEGLVPMAYDYVLGIVEHEGSLWCGTVFHGILRVDRARSDKPLVQQFGASEMFVYRAGGRPVFVRSSGDSQILTVANGKLVPDPLLGHVRAPRGFFVLAEDAKGNVWINSTPPRMVERLANGRYSSEPQPLVGVTAADIQVLRTWSDGTIWFGSDKGLFRYVPAIGPKTLVQPAPLIRRVVAGVDTVLFAGAATPATIPQLRHDHRRLRFEFAPASYRPGVQYQYRLDPSDAGWSHWTEEPFIDFTNLAPSDYVFRLRARGAGTNVSDEAQWHFTMQPPWYRTSWAYALWTLLALGLVGGIIALRTRALKKQAEMLEAQVAEQTLELVEKNELLEQANARLENLSLLDELTGVANRRFFENTLADEWNRAVRREEPLALILIDLDHFKELNDRRGHRAGDDCLRLIGKLLGETIRRSGEVVARYGGEEFAVLLPSTDLLEATRVAERLRHAIEKLDVIYGDGIRWRVTASCGVATMIPRIGETMDILVDRADRALYAAKHAGRNTVRVASEETQGAWLREGGA